MNNSRPVYSSDGGRLSPPSSKPPPKKTKSPTVKQPSLPDDGVVRIFKERGQRGGKIVTVIRGLPGPESDLEARALELKRLVGAGGTVRDGAIEIQGDHRERIAERLRALGYSVKLAGG